LAKTEATSNRRQRKPLVLDDRELADFKQVAQKVQQYKENPPIRRNLAFQSQSYSSLSGQTAGTPYKDDSVYASVNAGYFSSVQHRTYQDMMNSQELVTASSRTSQSREEATSAIK